MKARRQNWKTFLLLNEHISLNLETIKIYLLISKVPLGLFLKAQRNTNARTSVNAILSWYAKVPRRLGIAQGLGAGEASLWCWDEDLDRMSMTKSMLARPTD